MFMRMAVTLLRKAGYSVTIAAAVAFSSTAPAAPLSLPDTPLFLSAAEPPNLIMAIDDSSSMDNEVLFPTNDGAAWWRSGAAGTCSDDTNNSFVGCRNNAAGNGDIAVADRLNFNNAGDANGTWKKYVYLFPNGFNSANDSARRRAGDAVNDHFAIPPLPQYAWARSPTHNASYFDPKATYRPWTNSDDFTFADSEPTAARFDPVFPLPPQTAVTINLLQDVAGSGSVTSDTACTSTNANVEDNYYFKVYRGMTLPEGTCIRRAGFDRWERVESGTCEIGVNGRCDTSGLTNRLGQPIDVDLPSESRIAIRYYPATFYLPANTLDAGFGYTGATIAGQAPDGTALVGYEIKLDNFASEGQYNAAKRNFANWFTYYRKRHLALRAGLGESFKTIAGLRVDGFTINNRNDVTMANIDDPANRADLFRRFYTEWVRGGGTPNRSAVARIISNFKRTDDNAPVTQACQKNFGMLFTDGFSNSPSAGDGIQGVYNNVDGNQGRPYADDYSGSLADAVMSAYVNPLRSGGIFDTGKVSPQRGCPTSGTYSGGPLDCNRNLHMNFYAVTLGARGLLFDPDATTPVDPYANPPTWPTTFPSRHPSAVDDLWHATINGRGQLLNARSPQEISKKLQAVLSSITDQTSTAAAASVNGSRINAGSRIYQPRFDSLTWTGQILSYSVTPSTGELGTGVDLVSVPAASARKIYTRNTAGQPVEFTWTTLQSDTGRVALLDPNRNAAEAERMLNYLRGDGTNEVSSDGRTGIYRRRANRDGSSNKLGDIVGSAPLYVAAPPFRYRDSLETQAYSTFAARSRTPMIYVGANDGMLHAFNATTGTEVFAYIPSPVFPKLRNLASDDYGHQFYVDGSPSMGDAFFARNGQTAAWRTVLAGGLNKGGQGVYAIDITDPSSTMNDPSSMFLEFTDANDRDLGFTYSQPQIAKFRDNKWYLVFGNGYNSTFVDDNPSTTGNAVLFMIELGTGDVRKIDTGVGNAQRPSGIAYDNGLSTPVLADIDGDRVVEAVYAGDLFGNMWKFDVSSTDPSSWGVAFGRTPLFVARTDATAGQPKQVQPITVRPEVTRGPKGTGTMVLFGTGKYLEGSDKSRTPRVDQSFYGIVDNNVPVTYSTRASVLTRQTILDELTVTKRPAGSTSDVTSTVRVTSDNPLGGNQGWFIDLVSSDDGYQAEKQITNPQIRDTRVIFTTLIPDQDPCGFGGTGWLMELDVRDGSRLDDSPFDLNRDGLFTSEDNVPLPTGSTTPTAPSSGLLSQEGVPQMPVITYGEFGTEEQGKKPVQYKYMPGSSGKMQMIIENPGPNSTGRQSWRQVR
jgi:type IV pilus assembly protein PilY1